MSADASQSGSAPGSSTEGSANPFAAGLGASLGFFQDWMKAAGSAMPGMPGTGAQSSSAGSAMSGLSAWTLPTLDPQELEKRITDLKTVQFWLEQNARMIAMTIQGLEVQRMTLSTLKGMNVSMDALRESLKARASAPSPAPAAPAPAAAPTPEASAEAPHEGQAEPGGQGINPMQWWDTLTQQFTQLASQAARAGVDVGSAATNTMAQAAASATAAATTAASSAAEAVQAAAKHAPGTKKAARGAASHPPKRKPSPDDQVD